MAIAFDAKAGGSYSNTSPATWNHTCTGSNLVLFVHLRTQFAISAVTYNSVAMTQGKAFDDTAGSGWYFYIYYLVSPATGSNQISVSTTSSGIIAFRSSSFTGFTTSSAGGSNNLAETTTTTPQIAVTVQGPTGVIVDCFNRSSLSATANGTGQVQLGADYINGNYLLTSYKIHSGSNFTMSWSGGSDSSAGTAFELQGPVEATGVPGGSMLMGVGF